MTISIVRFLNVILAAILAGTSFGIWMGFNPLDLSISTYLEQQKNMVHSLNALMISLVFFATLITIASAFLQRKNKNVFIILLITAAFFIGCIVISRFGNQPLQNDIISWKANSVPSNWTLFRDKWWEFHIVRTITELIALALITLVSIKTGNISDKQI